MHKTLDVINAKEREIAAKNHTQISKPSQNKSTKPTEEKSVLESAFDWVKEGISDVYNY
jgi:hypothetical protein